jgi:ribosomal protein S18 acetylase RimI-like enzyme
LLLTGFKLKPLLDFMDAIPMDAFYLQGVAVYPQFRGQRIRKQLLAKGEELAYAEHARTLELDVEADNEIAISAYHGHGMRVASSSPELYFRNQRRCIVLHRMAKTLD